MPDCSDCRHHKSHLNWDTENGGMLPSTHECKNNQPAACSTFWQLAGKMTSAQVAGLVMPCFEPTDVAKHLDRIGAALDDLHVAVDKALVKPQ